MKHFWLLLSNFIVRICLSIFIRKIQKPKKNHQSRKKHQLSKNSQLRLKKKDLFVSIKYLKNSQNRIVNSKINARKLPKGNKYLGFL